MDSLCVTSPRATTECEQSRGLGFGIALELGRPAAPPGADRALLDSQGKTKGLDVHSNPTKGVQRC